MLLENALAFSRDLYNAALQEKRDAWRTHRKAVSYPAQCRELTELRAEDEIVRDIPVDLAREPLRRVHRAFQGFFRRCKSGEKAGYPRFKSCDRYNSMTIHAPHARVEGNALLVAKMGGFRFKAHALLAKAPSR